MPFVLKAIDRVLEIKNCVYISGTTKEDVPILLLVDLIKLKIIDKIDLKQRCLCLCQADEYHIIVGMKDLFLEVYHHSNNSELTLKKSLKLSDEIITDFDWDGLPDIQHILKVKDEKYLISIQKRGVY